MFCKLVHVALLHEKISCVVCPVLYDDVYAICEELPTHFFFCKFNFAFSWS